MYKEILVTIQDRVATLQLNRPDAGNAFAKDSYREIREALQAAERDSAVGAIVITGKGKHFSAGGDIKRFKGLIESKTYLEIENIHNAGNMAIAVRSCKKPVIAMINGAAAGAGMSLALACDFRVVSPSSKLVMAFIKLGLSGDTCGMYLLHKLVGVAKTTELMMLGTPVSGQEAFQYGLATILAQDDTLESETAALAKTLAHGPLQAFARQKRLMEAFFFSDIKEYMLQEGALMAECSRTKDFEASVNAFLDKKQPQFIGE